MQMQDRQDAILNYLLEEKGDNYVDKTIKRYQRLYQAAEGTKSYRDAANEMVNDTLVGLFTTDKGANDFVNWCTKNDKSVLEKITDFIQAIIDKLKSLISDANLSSEARTVAEMSEKQAQKIRDRLFKAMDKAIDNYKGAEKSETATGTRQSLNVKKQSVTIVNGTPIISGNAFSSNLINKSYKEVTEAIQNELRKLTNNTYTISADNREVHIGSDFADEYKGSNDTWSKNIVRRKAKANAIGGIEKIIETAKNPQWSKNKELKHSNDAKRGWTYYDIRFGIENPSNNAITYYEGILNVRMDADGQDYVYDITKIKKENLTHSKGGNKISSPSDPSIPPSQNNATTTSSGRYSLDTEGNKLTEGQQKYFQDSKVRDEQGRLRVMYHGTPNGEFNTFNNRLNFYTANKEYASRYATGSNARQYKGYLNIAKPFDITDEETKRIFIDEYVKGGWSYSIDPGLSRSEIEAHIKDGIDWTEADNLKDFIEENELDYDGLILNEGGEPTEEGVYYRGNSYVTFNSNQFKNIDNENPTNNADIRYSLDVPTTYALHHYLLVIPTYMLYITYYNTFVHKILCKKQM